MHSAPKPYMLLETDLIYRVHNSMHLEMVTALIYILPKSHTHVTCHGHGQSWTVLGCNLCSCLYTCLLEWHPLLHWPNKTKGTHILPTALYISLMCAVRKSCYLLFCQLSMFNGMSQHLDLPIRNPHTLVCKGNSLIPAAYTLLHASYLVCSIIGCALVRPIAGYTCRGNWLRDGCCARSAPVLGAGEGGREDAYIKCPPSSRSMDGQGTHWGCWFGSYIIEAELYVSSMCGWVTVVVKDGMNCSI